jgi:hypothetical protein
MLIPIQTDELTLTTPAVLFSAISLIMLAYTNRFLAYTTLVRNLKDRYDEQPNENYLAQIETLRLRLKLTRWMQAIGTSSLFLCVLSMFVIYIGQNLLAVYIFGIALLLLIVSLGLSVWEIEISSKSLDLHLRNLKK